MRPLGWLVLCVLARGAGGEVCADGTFTTSGPILGAQCPVSFSTSVVSASCAANKAIMGWYANYVKTYIYRIGLRCCPYGFYINAQNDAYLSCDLISVGFDVKLGLFDFPLTSLDQFSIPDSSGQAWGYNKFQTYWGSTYNGLVGFGLGSASNPMQTYNPNPSKVSSIASYECQPGTNIVGIYQVTSLVTVNSVDTKYFSSLGVQCMPAQCAAGQYSSNSASTCTACEIGKYNADTYVTACQPCTVGGILLPTGSYDTSGVTYTSAGPRSNGCYYTCNPGYGCAVQAWISCSTGCLRCIAGTYSVSNLAPCAACPAGTVSQNSGASACTPCSAGTYIDTTGGSVCKLCQTITPQTGYYRIPCTSLSNDRTSACTACPAGKYVSPSCNPGVTTGEVPVCVQCPAGQIQPNAIPSPATSYPTCDFCVAGQFQSSPGMSRCQNCKNLAPANGMYAAWTSPSINGTNCPTLCYPGFGWNGTHCVQCGLGQYGTGGLIPGSTCQACQPLTQNAYWLAPVVFNRSWSGCPWDCKAGYYKTVLANCAPCQTGKYSSLVRSADSDPSNQCLQCTVCSASYFSSLVCNASRDTTCSPCMTSCSAGSYLKVLCNSTTDNTCASCRSTCAAGQYMTRLCTGLVSLALPAAFL